MTMMVLVVLSIYAGNYTGVFCYLMVGVVEVDVVTLVAVVAVLLVVVRVVFHLLRDGGGGCECCIDGCVGADGGVVRGDGGGWYNGHQHYRGEGDT